jgi:hypothetical protein
MDSNIVISFGFVKITMDLVVSTQQVAEFHQVLKVFIPHFARELSSGK